MPLPVPNNPDPFRRLVDIMDALLSPEGCPWDQKQDHRSLKTYALEEAHEVCEAIDNGDMEELCGELGDLGLQIVFHAALAKRDGHFNVDDVYTSICDKLIRRHPHVFGDIQADDAATVLRNWEEIKRAERAAKAGENAEKQPSALDGIPKALPALQRAYRLQAKAARVGFDWGDVAPVLSKIREEIDELDAIVSPNSETIGAPVRGETDAPPALDGATRHKLEDELGDILFAIVNLARFLHIDPEQALQGTNRKFLRRFHYIEEALAKAGKLPKDSTLEEMDGLWNEAKRAERSE